METDCKYLFIYGSLLNAANEFGAYLRKCSTNYCKGSFKGVLYDMGEYPGAVDDMLSNKKVWGKIRLLNSPGEALKIIDSYEGFGPGEQHPNLFIRKLIPIQTNQGIVECWVYLYNLSITGFKQIVSGRYK